MTHEPKLTPHHAVHLTTNRIFGVVNIIEETHETATVELHNSNMNQYFTRQFCLKSGLCITDKFLVLRRY